MNLQTKTNNIKVEIITLKVDKLELIWLKAWAFSSKSRFTGPQIPDGKKWGK